ncbi:MAG TPA: hypothetical protein VI819_01395 [Patescibacteria group bacterium]|nr:hypothetical protein [Patescibacteria group bacterium]
MINTILIHGDDIEKSYHRKNVMISAAKKRGWDIVSVSKNGTGFKNAVTNPLLFSADRLIYVDKFSDLTEKDLAFLKSYEKKLDATVLFFNEGLLSAVKIKSLPKSVKIEKYDLPVLLWKFLDSIYPGNLKYSLKLFNDLAAVTAPEFVFSLMAKLFRDLYWVSFQGSTIPYPPWRIGKISSQAKKFDKNEVEKIIEEMSEIDIKVKTSRANLKESIDLLLIKHLE